MIPIWIKSNGSIEELLVCSVNLFIVLGGHHVMIFLPINNFENMILDLTGLLDWFSNLFNNPTLLNKINIFLFILKVFNRNESLMRCRNRCILNLIDHLWILRFLCESNVFWFHTDRLIEIFLVECVILFVVLAIGNWESIIPCTIVKLCVLLVGASRKPWPSTDRIFLETYAIFQRLFRRALVFELWLRLILRLKHSLLLSHNLLMLLLHPQLQFSVTLGRSKRSFRWSLSIPRSPRRDWISWFLRRISRQYIHYLFYL